MGSLIKVLQATWIWVQAACEKVDLQAKDACEHKLNSVELVAYIVGLGAGRLIQSLNGLSNWLINTAVQLFMRVLQFATMVGIFITFFYL